MSAWTTINGVDELPVGTWLVEVQKDEYWEPYHVAVKHKNITIVGGHFSFDMPTVIAYAPIPQR